ncbi:hypothetical protein IWW38_005511, partial [Coemansia aciculifera]
ARSWLNGTDVGQWIERDEASLLEDFGVLQELVAEYPVVFGGNFKWDCFKSFLNVASLVSSRAFSVDVHRDNSMVPLADIFNHRTAKENVHIVGEEMVCPVCGEAFGCEHMDALEEMDAHDKDGESESEEEDEDEGDSQSDKDDDSDDDYSSDDDEEEEVGEELPLLVDLMGDTTANGPQQQQSDGNDDDNDIEMESTSGEHSDDNSSDDDQEDELVDALEMVVFRPCKANTEVFNTYGEHGSAYLLHRYGFCDTKNPYDSVTLSTEDVMKAFTVSVSEQRAKDVAAVIRRFGDLFEPSHRAHGQEDEAADEDGEDDDEEVDDDDEEMHEASEDQSEDDESVPRFSIDSPGHPDLNFAALLALGLADEAVFAKASQSEQVFRHYFPVIRRFWAMFQDELDNDTPVPAAFRKANQDGAVKKSSIGLIANVVYRLAEARLL